MNLKILYDYQIFTEQEYGGISRYFSEVISRFKKDDDNDFAISSLVSNNYYLIKHGLNCKTFFRNINVKGKRKLMKFINRNYSKAIIQKKDFDILHPTYYDNYFFKYLDGKPFVITVHDLIYELFPQKNKHHERIRNQIRNAVPQANRIIAVSKNTKKDIIQYYGIPEEKIDVVYHGFIEDSENTNYSGYNFDLPQKYILFVGKRDGYKNFNGLLKAFAKIYKQLNLYLVCAGGGSFSKTEMKMLNEQKCGANVILFPQVTDAMLSYLYKNALAFIFPSKYEGFGIPILEAFSNGCPVILSNCSSFPEIAENAAIYFEPDSVDSIIAAIEKIFFNEMTRTDLITKGYNALKKFSWETCYKETINSYRKVIENKKKNNA